MVRIIAFLTVLGFLSGAMMGCHTSATVDPHSSGFITGLH
jgi:hypothetical protein